MTIQPIAPPSDIAPASTLDDSRLSPSQAMQTISASFGAFLRQGHLASRASKASICPAMERCFLALLKEELDPVLASDVQSLLLRFEGLSPAEIHSAKRWRNTLAFSRNPSKVGRELGQAKVFFGIQFANVAAIMLADRIDATYTRESQNKSDGFDEERQCLALAVKASKGAEPCWARLPMAAAAIMANLDQAKLLVKEGLPAGGPNAMGQSALLAFVKSSRTRFEYASATCLGNAEAFLAFLLANGAKPNETFGVDQASRFQNLPLMQAEAASNWSVAARLIEAGADGFARESPETACIFERLVANKRCPLASQSQAALDRRDLDDCASLPVAIDGARKPRGL